MLGWLWPNGTTTKPRLAGQGTPAEAEADFGPRTIGKKFHDGTDFVGLGTVRAVGGGRVTRIERWDGRPPGTTRTQHGNRVYVNHGGGIESSYSHLDRIDVNLGDDLDSADGIGPQGDTGFVTGSHLHLEVRVNGVLVDPVAFLNERINGNPASGGSTPWEEDDMYTQDDRERDQAIADDVELIRAALLDGHKETSLSEPRIDTIFDAARRIRGYAKKPDGTPNPEYTKGDVLQWIRRDIENKKITVNIDTLADGIAERLASRTGASVDDVRGIVQSELEHLTRAVESAAAEGARSVLDGATIQTAAP